MWMFYYELPDTVYQSPSELTVFLILYCILTVCILTPAILEKRRNEAG